MSLHYTSHLLNLSAMRLNIL